MENNEQDDRPNAVVVSEIKKTFRLPHENHSGLKQLLINLAQRKRNKGYNVQHVLKGVSFEVKKGDFFGIVGRNGSGKSTLLKLLAGIYTPDSGAVQTHGSVVPFIELGVGFNPELTGRENIFLNGALLGFSRDEMLSMYDEIVEFAELGRFMDQKLKNYSSGMQVRLAFSIAIKAQGDILILDEVLAVGDEAFQRKCNAYFDQIKKDKSKTVILVTHGMESVRKYCNRAMLLQDGRVEFIGNPDKIADEYSDLNLLQTSKMKEDTKEKARITAKVTSKHLLHPTDTLEVEITYMALNDNPIFAKAYIDLNGQAVMATNPVLLGWKEMITKDKKEHVVTYKLPLASFNKGEYKVITLLQDVDTGVNIASYGYEGETVIKIENPDKGSSGGVFANEAKMELKV
jgi:ABC-2 type transport system ATP-binding protein